MRLAQPSSRLASWLLGALILASARPSRADAMQDARAALATSPADRAGARHALEEAIGVESDPVTAAEALFRLGFLDEEDGAFEAAMGHHRACVEKAPRSNWARAARQRIGWISARSERGFAPLAQLQRVRGNPLLENDAAAIATLAQDAEAFPPGRVRAEARMFVAESWLSRTPAPQTQDAILELRRVVEDPSSDSTDASLARRHLLRVYLDEGRLDEASVLAHAFPASNTDLADQVRRTLHRRALWRALLVAGLTLAAGLAILVARGAATTHPSARSP
jgi:hypothetical protein